MSAVATEQAAAAATNSTGSPVCHRCHQPITTQFYKVGDHTFHKDHFSCSICEKTLHDTEFRFKDGDYYCVPHYEERYTHVCPGCQLKIVAGTGKVIKALGFYYHQACFVCTTCKTQLPGKFFTAAGKPYCAEHAKQQMEKPAEKPKVPVSRPPRRAPNLPSAGHGGHHPHANSVDSNAPATGEACQVCLKALGSDRVTMWGKNYHQHCLDCKYCHKNLSNRMGEKVYFVKEGDGQVVCCERDYKIMLTKWCNACGESITGEMVYINKGEYYHQDCFSCKQCGKKLDTYLCIAGELRCSDHTSASNADVSCASCKLEIELNKIYPAVGKKFHKHCLKCNFCQKDLEASDCKLRDGQLSCNNCLLEASLALDKTSPSPASAGANGSLAKPVDPNDDRNRSKSVDSKGRVTPKLNTRSSADRKNKVLPSPGHQKKHPEQISEHDDHKIPTDPLNSSNGASGIITTPEPDVIEDPSKVAGRSRNNSGAEIIPDEKDQLTPASAQPTTTPSPTAHVRNKSDGSTPLPTTPSSATSPAVLSSTSSNVLSLSSPRGPMNLAKTMTPRKISNWKKGEMIGRGQFGKVFVGLLETGQWIAVKQMDIKSEEDEQHVKNMEQEVHLMEKLRHENIVSLLGTQRDGQHFYILMEYVAGKSLDVLLKNFGPFPEVTIRWYTLQLVRALEFMHSHNIIHRDIKGKNILVDTNGSLKVADFGSAKQVDSIAKDQATISYNYTPLWTAPEVVTSGNYDRKVDIWSLGCVMIEMGTAKLPWNECKFENPFQILFHIGNATSCPELPNDVSETCKDFIRKCLTRDPDQRPDASELLNHEFLKEEADLAEVEFEENISL